MKLLSRACLIMLLIATAISASGHPMPSSMLLMDMKAKGIAAELRLPLKELEPAIQLDLHTHPETIVARMGAQLEAYMRAHFHPESKDGRPWTIAIQKMQVANAEQDGTGLFTQLSMQLWLSPPAGADVRSLRLRDDMIMHQVVTHKAFVAIRQDWETGQVTDSGLTELGIIEVNPGDNSVAPLEISLSPGGNWRGFKHMAALGIDHISEGTDHLLFLLVLMLPAPLIVRGGRWAEAGSTRRSVMRLVKIATAFTIGHSLTLLAGAMGWLRLPQQPVEVLIAVSILVTAIHAIRPLFPGRENLVALGFGLVHGLAFASAIAGMHLDGSRMALSILGFNAGIEIMQLFVMLLAIPWLLLLAEGRWYASIRIGGAVAAGIAALLWIAERSLNRTLIAGSIERSIATQGKWFVLGLAALAAMSRLFSSRKKAAQQFTRVL